MKIQRKEATIFAPHADDELIGCWSLVSQMERFHLTVVYFDLNTVRKREAMASASKHRFVFSEASWGESAFTAVEEYVATHTGVFWAPDPHWELHPYHKFVGTAVHLACLRNQKQFGTYSTSMNAPYLTTLSEAERKMKLEALEECYPSQRSLWLHDHRYILFEGRALWNPPA